MDNHIRPLRFYDKAWRKYVPIVLYKLIHRAHFRGSTRIKNTLALNPIDIELWISRAIISFLKPNSLFIDIGAHEGRHIRAVFEACVSGPTVIAFER